MGERDEGCRQESVLMRSTATIRRLSLFQAALQQPERCLISFTALVMCLSTHTDNASALEELNGQLSKRRDLARSACGKDDQSVSDLFHYRQALPKYLKTALETGF